MAAVVVRNLPEETLRALKQRAALEGRSTEAEIRAILESAVRPSLGIGSALAEIGRDAGSLTLAPRRRRRNPVTPADFG
jgi:antitoxin FitA